MLAFEMLFATKSCDMTMTFTKRLFCIILGDLEKIRTSIAFDVFFLSLFSVTYECGVGVYFGTYCTFHIFI
jgi:hypothetical protein